MKQFFLLLIISVVLFSCKKSEKTCELNEANFVGSFKVTSLIHKSNTDPGTDYFITQWADCKKDDIMVIQSDHVITYQDAEIACLPGGGSHGSWTLTGNAVNIDGQAGTVIYFDCNSMAITFPQSTTDETLTLSLSRQ